MMGIMDDELDIDTAQNEEDKEAAIRAKESKTWRILRLSAKSKLAAFDKIDDGKNLKILFEEPSQPAEGTPQTLEGTPQTAETTTKPSTEEEPTEQGQGQGQDAGLTTTAENGESNTANPEPNPAESNNAEEADTQAT